MKDNIGVYTENNLLDKMKNDTLTKRFQNLKYGRVKFYS